MQRCALRQTANQAKPSPTATNSKAKAPQPRSLTRVGNEDRAGAPQRGARRRRRGCHRGRRTRHRRPGALGSSPRRGRGARAKAAATHLPRGTLRDVLLDRLRPDTVRWGAKLESASPSEDGWSLTVDGVTESCSILVGADGVRSTARRLLCAEDAAATPLGVFVVLGFCAAPFDYAADCFEAVDGTVRIYTMPFDATRTMWQLSWRGDGPTGGDGEALREAALAQVSAWPGCPDAARLIEATAPGDVTGYPIVDRDLPGVLPPYATLLGDAAHPMAPFKAQGANQALLDAVSLARCLAATDLAPGPARRSVDEALAEYWGEMAPRAPRSAGLMCRRLCWCWKLGMHVLHRVELSLTCDTT